MIPIYWLLNTKHQIKIGFTICWYLILSVTVGLFSISDVLAQSQTVLSVQPPVTQIVNGSNTTININIENAVNLNSYEVEITYDPEILTLLSWQDGPFLSSIWHPSVVDTPGVIRIASVQLNQPAKNGSGTLLFFTFHGKANGDSPISFTYGEIIDKDLIRVFPSRSNGSILVHSDPASVPTRAVTGSFSLQGQSNASGVPVEFGYGQTHWLGPYSSLTTSGTPNLSLPNVAEDTYPITISLPRYLNVHEGLSKGFIVSSTSTVMPPLMLYGGNAVWRTWVDGAWQPDNIINAADVSLVGAQYLQSGPDLDGDVNYSGRVDIFDLAMVGANYGLTSKDVYATWLSVH